MSPRPLLYGFQDTHAAPVRVLEYLLKPLITQN